MFTYGMSRYIYYHFVSEVPIRTKNLKDPSSASVKVCVMLEEVVATQTPLWISVKPNRQTKST